MRTKHVKKSGEPLGLGAMPTLDPVFSEHDFLRPRDSVLPCKSVTSVSEHNRPQSSPNHQKTVSRFFHTKTDESSQSSLASVTAKNQQDKPELGLESDDPLFSNLSGSPDPSFVKAQSTWLNRNPEEQLERDVWDKKLVCQIHTSLMILYMRLNVY
ncbi:hypothetical protein CLU79DRAFT_850057 [Phycomyces nitens]|nr:hypothetical protein CLU79DRAFT_850057 [Phycomyces nitens]